MESVGRRVAELRAARGLTQEALAEELGVTTKYLQRVEAGRQNLTIGSLVDLGLALRTKPGSFFEAPASRSRARPGRPRRPPHS